MKDTEARESSPGQQLECKRKRIKILERTRATITKKKKKKLNKKDHLQSIHRTMAKGQAWWHSNS